MKGLKTFEYLNIIPLGSYDVLIGMDWLDAHHAIVDCHNKNYTCLDEERNLVIHMQLEEILKEVYIRPNV